MQSTITAEIITHSGSTHPSPSRQWRDYAVTSPASLSYAATSILGGILAIFAIWDIYTQITATTKNPKNIINWLNLTSSSIAVTGALGDVINRITAQKTNAIKWAQEIEVPKLLDFEHLGILAAALNATVSAYQCYQSIGQGDRAVTAAAGVNTFGSVVYVGGKAGRELNKTKIMPGGRLEEQTTISTDSFVTSDVIEDAGADALVDIAADSVLSLIPILDIVLFASQITSFIILLFKDNKFEHWARTSPFAKEKVTDEITDPIELYKNLINTIIQPRITNTKDQSIEGTGYINFYLPSMDLLGDTSFQVEAIWRLIFNVAGGGTYIRHQCAIHDNDKTSAHASTSTNTNTKENNSIKAKDIILLPEGRKIGKQYTATITKENIIKLNQEAIKQMPNIWLDDTDRNWYKNQLAINQTTENLELLSRGKITAESISIPIKQPVDYNQMKLDGKDAFKDDPNYIHPEKKHRLFWQFTQVQIEKIAETLRKHARQ